MGTEELVPQYPTAGGVLDTDTGVSKPNRRCEEPSKAGVAEKGVSEDSVSQRVSSVAVPPTVNPASEVVRMI